MTIHADIENGLLKYFDTNKSGLPDVYWPNIIPDSEDLPDEYLKIDILSATVETIGVKTLDRYPGLLQVMVNVREGTGEIRAKQYADKILTVFTRGTRILESGIRINIDKRGYISPPIPGDGWYSIAVSIPYNVIY